MAQQQSRSTSPWATPTRAAAGASLLLAALWLVQHQTASAPVSVTLHQQQPVKALGSPLSSGRNDSGGHAGCPPAPRLPPPELLRRAARWNPRGCQLDTEGTWAIGLFAGPSPLNLTPLGWPREDLNPVLTCASVLDPPSNFVADPFLWLRPNSSTWHLFFETKTNTNGQGDIGVAESSDRGSSWRYLGLALDEPWHLSYPFVFEWRGQTYMLPEGGGAASLLAYHALDFPLRWEKVPAPLLNGSWADSTLVQQGSRWWMFTTPSDTLQRALTVLHVYYSDAGPLGPWTPHERNPILTDVRGARSAGRVVDHPQLGLLRFAQDHSKAYGHAVRAYRIAELTPASYRQEEVNLTVLQTAPGTAAWNGVRRHHVDAHLMPDGSWLVAMDGDNRRS